MTKAEMKKFIDTLEALCDKWDFDDAEIEIDENTTFKEAMEFCELTDKIGQMMSKTE